MAEPTAKSNGRNLTLVALAEAKRLPADFLRELGLRDLPRGRVVIPYYDSHGQKILDKTRTALQSTGKGCWYWPAGKPLAAYGDWRIDDAVKAGCLFVVEGESDCWTLWHHGLPALGIPGANATNTLDIGHVDGVGTVYVCREPDQGGTMFLAGVQARLWTLNYSGAVYELTMPPGVKDPSDLHVRDPKQFRATLEARIRAAKLVELTPPTGPERRSLVHQRIGPGHDTPANETPPRLATTCLANIRPEPVRWLVPGYLPLGKLVLIAGDGGHGKSTLTLDLAACLTTGRPAFGQQYEPPPAADVLLISCEDDFGDTVIPRLLTAGADLARVYRVDGIPGPDGKVRPFSLAYYEAMERELQERPDVRLVVIDPAGAYVGRAGVDDHKDSELRSLLGPMSELAARRRVTIILIKHFNKGVSAKAVHQVGGGVGYVNTVRAGYAVVPDQDEPGRKLFLPLKCNLLRPGQQGIAYKTESLSPEEQEQVLAPFTDLIGEDRARLAEQLFRIKWLGPVDISAEGALAACLRKDRGPNKVEQAAEWLKKFLAEYAYPSEEITEAGKAAGFTFDNIKEAKAKLKSAGLRNSSKGRFQGSWWSGFGSPENWKLRPAPLTPESPHFPHIGETPWDSEDEAAPAPPHFGQSGEAGGERNGRISSGVTQSGESGECGESGSGHASPFPMRAGPDEGEG